MVILAGEEKNSDCLCYCFNRDCSQAKNPLDAIICNSCNSKLLLKDRYRAIELIGQGGFGRTFKGVDELQPSQPYCAIKQFWQESKLNTDKATLFDREAQRLKVLGGHSNIPALKDYFVAAGDRYLVQEFVRGNNLAQELSERGAWSENEVRQLLLEMLPLMQFVHNKRIIHRDIKPANIIRRQTDRSLVLVDFGAAKVVTRANLADTGTIIGSAAYIAPEQLRGKAVFASDIYSLGVTCIHLLTQIPPFDLYDTGDNVWNWRDYLSQPVSARLGKVLDKMLSAAVNQRYPSAIAVIDDLLQKPSRKRINRKMVLGASTAVLLTFLGLRALVSPVAKQVSTPIEQETPTKLAQNSDRGGLYSYSDKGEIQAFPLEHTAVNAKIAGNVSRVEVKQTFTNPSDKSLEAIYQFPLPDDAAVDDMEIRVGDRLIRGFIKKKEEAREIYQQAKQSGKTAGLLEQQRDNMFVQSLANIQPGEKIDVVIRYTNSLEFTGNDYEFAFPLEVAPRYGSSNSTGSLNPFSSPAWASDVPKQRSRNDVDLTVEIDAGVPIAKVNSPSHPVEIQNNSSSTRITLADRNTIPNKDLILRYRVMDAETQATVLSQKNQKGGHFATYLIPAVKYKSEEIVPKDVIFLIDTSRSQSGEPIEQSRELMRQFVSGLNANDTFNIINFSNTASKLADRPLPNNRTNRAKALEYISQLDANGGTEFMNGINAVLDFPAAPNGRLRSVVVISDGLIGGDEEIIGEIRDRLQPGNRLYSFGVGNSTNRFLLERMAELGRGTAAILPPGEDAVKVSERFFKEINNPVVTNIEVDWLGEGEAPEIYPQKSPDLFANQPLVLYGRKQDGSSGKLKITGTVAGGKAYEEILDVNFQQVGGNSSIAQLWGRSRIQDLMNEMYNREDIAGVEAVTETALDYNLLSKYTSFVAVTEILPKPKDKNASVPEPSEIIGNLLALMFLIAFFTRKRWHHLLKALLHKIRF